MKIALTTNILPSYRTQTKEQDWDIKQLKRALTCTGFYIPDPETGMTTDADPQFYDALYAFQRKNAIMLNDTDIGPGSTTERLLNAAMAEQEGLYVWRTVGDEKVRDEHALRAGKRFTLNDPPEGGHAGEDYNCRCWPELINPPYHPWIEWVKEREQARRRDGNVMSTGAMGMPLPDEQPLPPEWQEASAAAVLWDGARITVAACWANGACRAWMLREGAKIILENTHHLPPKTLPAFPDAEIAPRRGVRQRWVDSKGRIYEWDYQHGEVEVYDKTGKHHEGGFDPNTGRQTSPKDKKKKVKK